MLASMDTDAHTRLTMSKAAPLIDPNQPPHRDTIMRWHDRLKLPRDYAGRRIWTQEICERIRKARAEARPART